MNTEKNLYTLQDTYEEKHTCASCGCRLLGFCAMNWNNEWYCYYCWERGERGAKVAKTASKARSDELESMRKERDALQEELNRVTTLSKIAVPHVDALRKERDALQATLERANLFEPTQTALLSLLKPL